MEGDRRKKNEGYVGKPKLPHLPPHVPSSWATPQHGLYGFFPCHVCHLTHIYRVRSRDSVVPWDSNKMLPTLVHCHRSGYQCGQDNQRGSIPPCMDDRSFWVHELLMVPARYMAQIHRDLSNLGKHASPSPAPFVTFVNSIQLWQKAQQPAHENVDVENLPALPCNRYLSHMHMHQVSTRTLHSHKQNQIQKKRCKRLERETITVTREAKEVKERPVPPKSPTKVRFVKSPQSLSLPPPPHVVPSVPPSPQQDKPSAPPAPVHDVTWPLPVGPEEFSGDQQAESLAEELLMRVGLSSQGSSVEISVEHELSPELGAPSPSQAAFVVQEPPTVQTQPTPEPPAEPPLPHATASPLPKEPTPTAPTPSPPPSLPPPPPPPREPTPPWTPPAPALQDVALSSDRRPPTVQTLRTPTPPRSKEKTPPVNPKERSPAQHPTGVAGGGEPSISSGNRSHQPAPDRHMRWHGKRKEKASPRASPLPDTPSPDSFPMPEFTFHRVGNWIYGNEDFNVPPPEDFQKERNQDDSSLDAVPSPTPPHTPSPPPISAKKEILKKKPLPEVKMKRRGQKQRDDCYAEELRKQMQAEERRQKQIEMLEKLKNQQRNTATEMEDKSPKFEDYGWLANYCILNKGMVDMFRKAFEVVDEEHKGWLEQSQALTGLRAINQRLTHKEEQYIQRILEVTGYKLMDGADFKLFCVVAALSQKVAELDDWMKQIIGQMDYSMLDMRIFKARKLWECNVDHETQKISLDQLCVELRAGGVSAEHEREVRQKLGHVFALDLLDFLTYIPLFVMVHLSVVHNPLSETRDK